MKYDDFLTDKMREEKNKVQEMQDRRMSLEKKETESREKYFLYNIIRNIAT